MIEELKSLAREAEVAAEFYRDKPGYIGPETTIDLYMAIAHLARIIADATPTKDSPA